MNLDSCLRRGIKTPGLGAFVPLLGLNFADVTAAGAAAWLADRPEDAPFRYVVTPNADHLVRLSHSPALVPFYRDALLCLMDSRVVAKAARLLGLVVPRVATGSDLTELLLRQHLRPGERVTIIGLRPALRAELVRRLRLAEPAHFDPPMGFDANPESLAEAVSFVLAHPARFVFLAVGSPRQERLAAAIQATGQATGTGLCIGASLEFLAGVTSRAPAWMQRAGFEWMYRLYCSPRRLARRYLRDDPPIFMLLLRERLRQRDHTNPRHS